MDSASWIAIAVGAFLPLLMILMARRRADRTRPGGNGPDGAEGRK